jgi:hypothetical protein
LKWGFGDGVEKTVEVDAKLMSLVMIRIGFGEQLESMEMEERP